MSRLYGRKEFYENSSVYLSEATMLSDLTAMGWWLTVTENTFPRHFRFGSTRRMSGKNSSEAFFHDYAFPVLNHPAVLLQIPTSINITGTSMSTPTTVASAAPDERPKSITAVAMATSK